VAATRNVYRVDNAKEAWSAVFPGANAPLSLQLLGHQAPWGSGLVTKCESALIVARINKCE
jgi:hypothetical protein